MAVTQSPAPRTALPWDGIFDTPPEVAEAPVTEIEGSVPEGLVGGVETRRQLAAAHQPADGAQVRHVAVDEGPDGAVGLRRRHRADLVAPAPEGTWGWFGERERGELPLSSLVKKVLRVAG